MQKLISLFLATLVFPSLAMAHGVHGNGFVSGFTHPILGLDHFLAIIATGVLGYISYREKWYLPSLTFLVGMIVSGYFGIGNEASPFIEKVIALSILLIGVFILIYDRMPLLVLLIFSLVFGSFHGYAHGAEMSPDHNFIGYITGYALGTSLVSVAGTLLVKTMLSNDHIKSNTSWLLSGIFIGAGFVVVLG